jgi:IS30 family transposase
MAYKQLDFLKRCKIHAFWKAGYNQTQIAKEIGVHKSTISREFKRNMTFVRTSFGSWQYKTHYAQTYTEDRHKHKNKHRKFTPEVEKFVRRKLQEQWSPEQICGYAERHSLFSLKHECIYRFILKDKVVGGDLYKNLRHQNKKYRKRYGSYNKRGPIKNRIFIDDRPEIVIKKSRIGDWEIDTIIGSNKKEAVVSIVERKSKKTILRKVSNKTAKNVAEATIDALKLIARKVYTIGLQGI